MSLRRAVAGDRGVIAAVAVAILVVQLVVNASYGFHRDELYLMICGRHLDWGSADHAPLAPAISWLSELVFGAAPAGQRVFAAIAGAVVVALAGLSARRLGGNRTAQLVAMAAVATAPVFLYSRGVHGTLALEQLACAVTAYLAFAILTAPAARGAWGALGAALGIGVLGKYTVVVFALALAVGAIATPARHRLASRWPLVALAVGLAIALPNLVWQYAHGGPALAFFAEHHAARARTVAPGALLYWQPVLLGPLAFAVAAIGGAAGLRRGAAAHDRVFAVALVAATAVFVVLDGKPYYLAPLWPPLIAIGAVRCGTRIAAWCAGPRRALWAAAIAAGAIAMITTLPVVPAPVRTRLGLDRLDNELVQFLDWRGVVEQIGAVHRAQRPPGGAGILTSSYGTAAAIDVYGPALGLPPASSGANSYHAWGPRDRLDPVLAVGYAHDVLTALYAEVVPVGRVETGPGVDNRFDVPRVIYRCRGLRLPLAAAWARLRVYD